MVDGVLWDQRGDNDGRNPRPVLFEGKTEFVMPSARSGVPGGYCEWRDGVVEKTAMLIPGNDEDAIGPYGGVSNGFVSTLDEAFAEVDIIERVLRGASSVVLREIVTGFDKDVVVVEITLEIRCEVLKLTNVIEMDAFNCGHHGKEIAGV
jgi:hypothetical protein